MKKKSKENRKFIPVVKFEFRDPVQWWKKEVSEIGYDKPKSPLSPTQKKLIEKEALKKARKVIAEGT